MTVPSAFVTALAARPVLHTSRLCLRTPVEADIPAIIAIAGDWEVARRLARMPHPYTAEHARYFLDVVVPAELVWAIVERASGDVVGVVGLSAGGDHLELGYYIAQPHWGRGLATEAGAVVVAYGAGLVGQGALRSGYFADNPASGRVLAKLGFIAVAQAERPCLTTGETKRSVEVAMVPGRNTST